MMPKPYVSLSLIAVLMLIKPLWVSAFSLGNIAVSSTLNQPFQAIIPVNAIRDDERSNLQVALASEAEFERASLQRSLMVTQLQFAVTEQNGKTQIEVRSQSPVKEPILDFLIAVSAGEGRMLKSYTALLDPPDAFYQLNQITPEISNIETAQQPTSTFQDLRGARQYQVTETDTLWRIASNNRPNETLTVQQIMMAILATNPRAFQYDNINGLMAGMQLDIPVASDIEPMSAAAASQAVKNQTAAWQQRQQTAVANTTVETTENDQVQSDAKSSKAQTTATENAEATTDASQTSINNSAEFSALLKLADRQEHLGRLDIIAADTENTMTAEPEITGSQAADLQRLNTRLMLAQETIEAQSDDNVDMTARLDQLETQLETMRRLLSLRDADMARLQTILEESSPTASQTATIEVDNRPLDAPVVQQVASNTTNADNGNVETPPIPQKSAATQYLDEAWAVVGQNLLLILLGALLLLLLLWFWQRRRQETYTEINTLHQESRFSEQSDTSPSNSMVAPEVTEIDDINQPEMSETEKDDIDKLKARADMFIGYANYDQARAVLEKARAVAPDNKSITTSLLYVLYKQEDKASFKTALDDSALDSSDPEWPDILIWGQALLPGDAHFYEQLASQQKSLQADTEAESVGDESAMQVLYDNEMESASEPLVDAAEQQTADTVAFKEVAPVAFDYEQQKAQTERHENDDADKMDTIASDQTTEPLNFFDQQTADSDADNTLSTAKKASSLPVEDDSPDSGTDNETVEADPEPIQLYIDDQPLPDQDTTVEPLTVAPESDALPWTEDANLAEPNKVDFSSLTAEPALPDSEPAQIQLETDTDSRDEDEEMELDFDLGSFDDMDEAETKLDLAAAYIEIGDQEAARSILQEVFTDGSETHKQRAQALLDELN